MEWCLRNTGSFCSAWFCGQPGACLLTCKSTKYIRVLSTFSFLPLYDFDFSYGLNPWQPWVGHDVGTELCSWEGVWTEWLLNSNITDVIHPPNLTCCRLTWLIVEPFEEGCRAYSCVQARERKQFLAQSSFPSFPFPPLLPFFSGLYQEVPVSL